MNDELKIDALKLKRQLQENAWKNSGAKNLHEYVIYANKVSKNYDEKCLKKIKYSKEL
jgi:hypothetical protein